VALAGVVSFMVYMLILFGVFYFDHSIKTAAELANATGAVVLGSLPFIKASQLDVEQLWNNDNNRYKNLLNDIRFEIDRDMERSKVLLINSMLPEEGKTIFTLSLAYAYARIYRKVLVIDGNFVQPHITQITNAKYLLEDYLKNNIELTELNNTGPFSVLG
ncbi:hypothetical protein V4886_24840, partial [Ralstonia solanacearum species complex bacterium RW470]|uniref:hypothetical protein n=1 Tax=Ralstonia solanacearum species complex bacterium RW470 TaxID=3119580 RepID=UPI002FC29DBB